MDFLTLAQNRYTTKKYNPNQKISSEKIEQLMNILRLSPSSINSQPWKFTIIADQKLKSELASVSFFNEPKINDASHVVVFSAIDDVVKFEAQIKEYLPEGAVGYFNQFIKPMPETEIKAWLRHQVYLSLGFFLSACAAMGIDATPMEGIKTEEYNKLLKNEGYTSLFAVAIGYRATDDVNQPALKPKFRLPLENVVEII